MNKARTLNDWKEESFHLSHTLSLMSLKSIKLHCANSLVNWNCLFWQLSSYVAVVKNLLVSTGGAKDVDLIPGLGRYPGEGTGNPLQYSCLENPMDSKAWQATVCGVAKSRTWLNNYVSTQIPSSTTAGLYGEIILSFRKIYKTVLLNGYAVF